MKRVIHLVARLAVCGLLFSCAAFSGTTYASAAEHSFVSRTAEIDGVKLHYTTGGHGPDRPWRATTGQRMLRPCSAARSHRASRFASLPSRSTTSRAIACESLHGTRTTSVRSCTVAICGSARADADTA